MNSEIQKILADLYEIDPSLKEKENEIVKIIDELVASKPDTKFDENFKKQLRARVMEKAAVLSSKMPVKEGIYGWFTLPRFAYALGGLAVLALIIVPTLYYRNRGGNGNTVIPFLTKSDSGIKITKLASNAFGKLSLGEQQNLASDASGAQTFSEKSTSAVSPQRDSLIAPSSPSTAPLGMGGGGSVGVVAPDMAVSPKMMPIRAQNYKFVYKGGDLPGLPDNLDVFKRVTDGGAISLSSLMGNTGLNFIDWSKFSNTKLQNISFTEDRENGYQVYVNFDDESVSINQNWPLWSSAGTGEVRCMAIGCVQPPTQPIKIKDVPEDSRLIEVANNFLSDYGISRSNYGQPYVQNDWRINYEATTDKANYWIPDNLSVVYPLVVNGKEVYDESGNKTGLTVNVDIRQMKVSGAWNLMTQNYQSSSYETEKDSARIIKIAENGGFRQIYYLYGDNGDVKDIELGTPTLNLVKMWFYRDNQNQELLVPAYVFPITNKPSGVYYYQNSVIVPVIKEVLDWGNNNGGGIVPMMKGDVQTEPAPASMPAAEAVPLVK